MVLSWCRMKQAQLRALSSQFRHCYFQIHGPSLVIREASIGAVTSPSMAIHKTGSELGNYVRYYAAPVQVKPKYEEKDKDKGRPRMNEQISAQYVRLVTDEGHGVVSRHEALDRARRLGIDLVEVQADANPPVCKLMDYNKEIYARQAKEKELTKKKSDVVLRKGSMKEVRITCKIDGHDLQTKADGVRRLTERGHRVKCMAVGTADQDLGGLLTRFAALVDEFTLVESGPRVEAKQAYIVVRHVKFGPLKKGPGKKKVAAMLNEKVEQNLDESGSEEDMSCEEAFEVDSPPETSNMDTTLSENRYASKRQTNASAPGPDNRYAATRPTNGSENRYATTRPTNVSGSGSDNRYAATNASGPGSENRYAAMRPVNASDPGMRRRFEPESQNPGSSRQFGQSEPNNDPRRENRYKKGPTSPSDYHVNKGGRGDFSRENANLNPGGIRDGFRR
ncbi:translation initiation factor IF3-1, mitochondrial [Cynara cardunculus var. scolymus]|uniref:Translation initiation factor 3 N-terminal domain-containing protein n=1 Tax=Cynara cardunculus var. scolymus TaxID=59895 RepID=A0A118JTH8_CYNCS|nr:translation initiation factor IF3-1, mitochondrial [Cynara cardunculus var. scolymus]KVH89889.1 hypothetical protein Ccrd_008118 [Cynara cardunculus var. scolymus]